MGECSAVYKPQVPEFYRDDPKTWFLVVEAEFRSFPSCSDNTKFSMVIKALDPATLKQINYILSNHPDHHKYEAIKRAILDRFASSRHKEIRKLLKDMTLGDRKPSQLLREMKDIAGTSADNDFLYQLWSDCLPADFRTFLAINDTENVDSLAKVAGRIFESRDPYVMATISQQQHAAYTNRPLKNSEKNIDDTQQMLTACLRELKIVKEQQIQHTQYWQQTPGTPLQVMPQFSQFNSIQ